MDRVEAGFLSRIQGRLGARVATDDLYVLPILTVMLLVRVLTDDQSASNSRLSGSPNLSAGIAAAFILGALGMALRRHRGLRQTALAVLWLGIWTAVAVQTRGASAETLREGVREASVIALASILYNARDAISVSSATRMIQFLGFVPALLALVQIATNSGADIAGELRANGTFAHPNSAAMFFAIAATGSLWQYLDNGRRAFDALLLALFGAALVATFSIDGLITLAVMLVSLGAIRSGPFSAKAGPWALAVILLASFFATPLGSRRIAKESTSNLAAAERGEANSSLDWRIHKWKTLIPEWEHAPALGRGLGTTVTVKRVPGSVYIGEPPHNEFIRYLVETGVLGFAILLWALGVLSHRLLQRRRVLSTRSAANLAIVVAIGCLVNSLADNTLLNSPTAYAAALVLAAALKLPSKAGDSAPKRQHAV